MLSRLLYMDGQREGRDRDRLEGLAMVHTVVDPWHQAVTQMQAATRTRMRVQRIRRPFAYVQRAMYKQASLRSTECSEPFILLDGCWMLVLPCVWVSLGDNAVADW